MALQASYPVTYQPETAPSWLHHAAVLGGHLAPDPSGAFRYLELGCGRGYSALLHAAAHPNGRFVAVDANPDAIAAARDAAEALKLSNIAFDTVDFAANGFEGQFDFIVLHGVYSWVTAETRARLRAILRERLAPGGISYVSYNSLPGWAGELPLRRLLSELSADGVAAGAQMVDGLRKAGFAYFTANPTAERAVAGWSARPEGYLAHEYLADAWDCLWSVDVMDEMAEAGLAFAGSATLRDHHDALLLDESAARAVAALATPRQRMLAQDFARNRGFRRDLFGRDLPPDSNGAALRDLVIESTGEIPESIVVPRGRVSFQPAFIAALRGLMAKGPQRLGDAVRALGESGDVARNLMWLTAAGALSPAVPDRAARAAARTALAKMGVVPES
ncbi:MAG: methyltransferase regulatory domain-containing protein [Proteobacteria bacterium]|nr:methyltransferase regulatory domain-containing protein [Pseudomonadota bacterium]